MLSSKPWSDRLLQARIQRGSHQSCLEFLDFLREELLDFTKKGFWIVLPFRMVQQLQSLGHLLGLRVSPMGVVPQRNRRPRIIVDLSFYDINRDTVNFAPKHAMQFGRTLERLLYQIRHANPRYGHVYLAKVDLSDGFYRVALHDSAIAKLAVALPRFPGEEQLLALPLVLPMGWVESPPFFCAVTETAADLTNQWPANSPPLPHPLEGVSQTPPPPDEVSPTPSPETAAPLRPHPTEAVPLAPHVDAATPAAPLAPAPPVLRPFHKPVRVTDLYMDDFIQAVQGNPLARLNHLRKLLHSIDAVFRPLDSQDSPHRKHVPSMKKFLQGDAYLSTRKIVLGWLIDTVRQTLELPPHRIERLQTIFDSLRFRNRIATKQWHKILGELRSMSIGIPGSRGLFSLLQEGLRHSDRYRIRITTQMRDMLEDFEHLTQSLASRPTEIAEIVPDHPVAVGTHDALALAWAVFGCPPLLTPTSAPCCGEHPSPPTFKLDLFPQTTLMATSPTPTWNWPAF